MFHRAAFGGFLPPKGTAETWRHLILEISTLLEISTPLHMILDISTLLEISTPLHLILDISILRSKAKEETLLLLRGVTEI